MVRDKLPRSFYDRDTLVVARDLLGRRLVRRLAGERLSGRIVEVEAYLGPFDPASHARHGELSRAAPMFGEPGHAYVYFTYGMYYCLNTVTESAGSGTGILIRAIEPQEGIGQMRANRTRPGKLPPPDRQLTNGPGKLAQAMAIDLALNRADLTGDALWLEEGNPVPAAQVGQTARIGITHGREHHHRFYVKDAVVSTHPKY